MVLQGRYLRQSIGRAFAGSQMVLEQNKNLPKMDTICLDDTVDLSERFNNSYDTDIEIIDAFCSKGKVKNITIEADILSDESTDEDSNGLSMVKQVPLKEANPQISKAEGCLPTVPGSSTSVDVVISDDDDDDVIEVTGSNRTGFRNLTRSLSNTSLIEDQSVVPPKKKERGLSPVINRSLVRKGITNKYTVSRNVNSVRVNTVPSTKCNKNDKNANILTIIDDSIVHNRKEIETISIDNVSSPDANRSGSGSIKNLRSSRLNCKDMSRPLKHLNTPCSQDRRKKCFKKKLRKKKNSEKKKQLTAELLAESLNVYKPPATVSISTASVSSESTAISKQLVTLPNEDCVEICDISTIEPCSTVNRSTDSSLAATSGNLVTSNGFYERDYWTSLIAGCQPTSNVLTTQDIMWFRPAHFTSQTNSINNQLHNSTNSNASIPLVDLEDPAKGIGDNICIPDSVNKENSKTGLRPVIIDGCNVAFSHGRNKQFSEKGLCICVRYFQKRGHKVKVILPNYRKGFINDKVLDEWDSDGTLVSTPSRRVDGKNLVSEDDNYVIQCAAALEGIIVTTDHYRDHTGKNRVWDETIKKRLLMFTWVDDVLIFPSDPLGRNGPTLEEFLKFPDIVKSTDVGPCRGKQPSRERRRLARCRRRLPKCTAKRKKVKRAKPGKAKRKKSTLVPAR